MKKIKIAEAPNRAIDWLVATAEGYTNLRVGVFSNVLIMDPPRVEYGAVEFSTLNYTADPAQAWPIIEREDISIIGQTPRWACVGNPDEETLGYTGATGIEAAMRCFCVSRYGEEAEVPEELLA